MELKNINSIEDATSFGRKETFRLGAALLFIVAIMFYSMLTIKGVSVESQGDILIVIAAMIGAYMAINIGANDVANNVGPAVGSKALTLTGAIVIAVIFEAAGALIAGGDVVSTIKKGIIDPTLLADKDTFVWLMMAALLGGAIWLNIATAVGAPVSTTHSIVGGVLGAGIAAGGWQIANWSQMGAIAASWIISPMLGGLIAAGFLFLIKHGITYRADKLAAARKIVPILVSLMVWAFSVYLLLKGVKKIWKVEFGTALLLGLAIAVAGYFIVKPLIAKASLKLENNKQSVNSLFTVPLIFGAALLSFAHGANDVANAVGPLAAIYDALTTTATEIHTKAAIPLWIMTVGALGIAVGLMLYGPKLIRTVGSEITELDQMRAFCIAMAAAITVIIASQLGLPVSSTHIAVGGVFGVGFLREHIKKSHDRMVDEIMSHHEGSDQAATEEFLVSYKQASVKRKQVMLKEMKKKASETNFSKKERKKLKKVYRHELVKRSALLKIAAAWVITVPVSGLLSALLFYAIRGIMLP